METTARPLSGGRSPSLVAYRSLADDLANGKWATGSRLPSERALAAELGVSRTILRHALRELAEAGLLEPAPQRGWFVTRQRLSEGPNTLAGFTENARERGLNPGARIICQQARPASVEEAEAMGLSPAAEIVEIERVRTLDGLPTAVQTLCFPARLVPGLERVGLEDISLYELLYSTYEIKPARCDYTLQAERAELLVAQHLEIDEGAPVLVGRERTVDGDERVICVGRIVHRGDAYRFTASLYRF